MTEGTQNNYFWVFFVAQLNNREASMDLGVSLEDKAIAEGAPRIKFLGHVWGAGHFFSGFYKVGPGFRYTWGEMGPL